MTQTRSDHHEAENTFLQQISAKKTLRATEQTPTGCALNVLD